MPPSISAVPATRSRTRRVGKSAYRLLLVVRDGLVALVSLVILIGGIWISWSTAQHVVLIKGHERGTITVRSCGDAWCTGPFTPVDGTGDARPAVQVDSAVVAGKGDRLPVVVKPGTTTVIRTGMPGLLHAWVPLGGSLLLAAVVVAGGLDMRRTAWALAGLGAVLLSASFATL